MGYRVYFSALLNSQGKDMKIKLDEDTVVDGSDIMRLSDIEREFGIARVTLLSWANKDVGRGKKERLKLWYIFPEDHQVPVVPRQYFIEWKKRTESAANQAFAAKQRRAVKELRELKEMAEKYRIEEVPEGEEPENVRDIEDVVPELKSPAVMAKFKEEFAQFQQFQAFLEMQKRAK